MIKSVLTAFAVLVAVPTVAQAAEPFNGPFVGIQGGWQQDRQRLRVDDGNVTSLTRSTSDGFAYGGQVGYDLRLSPRTVFGIEASLTGRTSRNGFDDGFANAYDLRLGRTVNATARAGFLIQPGGLLYVRGGYSNARFELNDSAGRISQDRDGYTLGVGYEQAITRALSARLEYNYSDYRSRNLRDVAFDIGADNVREGYRRNAVAAGLNFHF